MRPVIGITTYAQEASWGVWHLPAALIPLDYVDAVERAGGRAVLIPPSEEGVEETLEALDGIVFSGGADVDPAHYGADAHPETDAPQARRDAGELALLRAALERDMPTLAICRGFQLLNVARGGDLVQHLPRRSGTTTTSRSRASSPSIPSRSRRARGSRSDRRRPPRGDVAPPPGARAGRGGLVETAWAAGRHARGGRGSFAALRRRRAVASRGGRGPGALRGARRAGARVPRREGSRLRAGASRGRVGMYWTLGIIYVALSVVFIADVLRQPRALRRRQGALDRGAPRRAGVRVGRLRDLADAAEPGAHGRVTLTVLNPATEEPIAELEQAGVEEADEAVARAKAAFPAWRASRRPTARGCCGGSRRSSRRTREELARIESATSASRSRARAARSAWSRRSSTSTRARSTSTTARRSRSREASRRRSASRSASSA